MLRTIAVVTICCSLCCPIGLSAEKRANTDEQFIVEVLEIVQDLKPGDSRGKLEKSFELDGGLQFPANSRYALKSCPYIKINIEFSGAEIQHRADFLPDDRIVKVSKPYLEYPVTD